MQNVILQPIEVGGQTFKNRIMFPPLTTGYEKNGMISEQDMGFYTRLAKGGVGYIVMGDVAPINSFSPTPKLFDDSQIPAFKALADSVHAYGTKLGVQLFHPEYDVDAINSLFMQKKFDEMRQRLHHDMMFFTDEVSEEMLMAIIDKMCACAVRAQKAGVDVIQIHGDRLNGCLCSTRMNHRTDKFGGSLENRVRFARMLTRAIRKAVPDMVIDYKLSIVTPQRGKGGIDEADAVQFAQWLVEDGVDMFHVAQANHTGNMADTIPPMGVQPYGFFVKIAGDIKKGRQCAGQRRRSYRGCRNGCACHRERHGRHGCHGSPAAGRPRLGHQDCCREGLRYPPLHQLQQGLHRCHPEPSVPLLRAERGERLREHPQHPARSAEKEDRRPRRRPCRSGSRPCGSAARP